MSFTILVHPAFDATWPWSADHARRLCAAWGDVEFVRVPPGDARPVSEVTSHPESVRRLLSLGVPLTPECLEPLPELREVFVWRGLNDNEALRDALTARGVRVVKHLSEGFWGQSVAEFALALTLCGLRRIPQTHHNILTSLADWDYTPRDGWEAGTPNARGAQYGDDHRFTSGTVEGKRVRVVGAGNIASRYASFCHFLGADVAAYDPYAPEPGFHRAGARREHFLDLLVRDAEIFAPLVPATPATTGLVTAAHIEALPEGTLVVLATRAQVVDVPTLRRRVLADELALAADVFDIEPLPLDDPLLGRHNVVHTPHNAGRTRQANERYVEHVLDQFTKDEA